MVKDDNKMAWIRLDGDFFTNDEIVALPVPVRYAILGTFSYIKSFGTRGKVKATASQIARTLSLSNDSVVTALKTSIFKVEGKTIQVLNWQDFRIDPTSTERQRRHRNPKSLVTDVTGQAVSHGCHDYGTGQDVTLQDEGETPAPDDFNPEYAAVLEAWCKRKGISPINIKSRDREYVEQYARARGTVWCVEAIKRTSEVYLGRCFVEQEKLDKTKKLDSRDAVALCSTDGCEKKHYRNHQKLGYLCYKHYKQAEG